MGILGTGSRRGSIRRTTDSNVVGLRYEKTVQAQAPIPLPPRNNSRINLRTPSIRSPASSPPPSLYARSIHSPSPVVVAPPRSPLPAVAPPTEQHPALRNQLQQARLSQEEWKRDSGHAPAPSSPTTIKEEDCESDCENGCGDKTYCETPSSTWSTRIDALIKAGAVPPPPPSPSAPIENRAEEGLASTGRRTSCPNTPVCDTAPVSASHSSLVKVSTISTINTSSSGQQLRPHQPSSPSVKKQKSVWKKFGVGSSPSVRRSKLEMGLRSAASVHMQPLVRGSPPPAAANEQLHQTTGDSETPSRPSTSFPGTSSLAQLEPLFTPLGIAIPTENLLEDDFMASLSFSNRGSMMLGGRRVAAGGLDGTADVASNEANASASLSQEQSSHPSIDNVEPTGADEEPVPTLPPPDIRVLTADVEKESQKVRSLYLVGDTINWEDGARHSYSEPLSPTPEVPTEEDGIDSPHRLAPEWGTPNSANSSSHPDALKRHSELAGGIEDWEDIDGAAVDRYGFITATKPSSRLGTPTELKSAQFSPRRRTLLQKRDPLGSSPLGVRRIPSRKLSARSLNTQNSGMSTASKRSSRSVIRQASNLLPHNRDRRWMDEAGDMLTASPNLQDAEEEAEIERISEALKRKEWERSEKWRKMAKVVRKGGQGEGMEFEFDVKNPKLIERTWKGIPDRWRAAAWWSFMSASAKEHGDTATDEEIMASFHELLARGSPDDVQIDLDVPRTISRHIMFRKRYRGGQRLLFRVLHCLSIYFPDTGYVQGMASLAATLLCYFDEEKCFVMLVRMWQLRGLDRLYRPGFEGLMKALGEFDGVWLSREVSERLTELCIDITAYGTRWYLTLFNLSIPFPAQLRVWDVFLLLGDGAADYISNSESSEHVSNGGNATTGLDILHATSAALIQALREVLMDSDFENAMKALTSWIPIKDEDLLMKVAKAEWKLHQSKKA